jgi:predicted ATPase/DNA-binding CsgD family transcriptional regulator
VTLTGPAGVGKTRLALAVAEQVARVFPDPPVVVDLSAVREPAQVLGVIAERLGVQGEPSMARLVQSLQGRRLLVVLDNFEQVLPAAADVPTLLTGAPGLQLLVTSRVPLGLRAEQVYVVPPLALPDLEHLPAPAELAHVAAVRLFLERARALGTPIELTTRNARDVAELVAHLDGLPLAIKLAAARVRLLSPRMILERLGERLSLLHWEARDLPERQRTLAAAIAWSYELLSEVDQALFRRIGVFAGGFTLEAAEAVSGAMDHGQPAIGEYPTPLFAGDVLEGLAMLVDSSLVVSDPDEHDGRRYRLLESMRDFALSKLAEHAEEQAARRAHAAYFVALAERAEPAMRGPEQRIWFRRLQGEQENLRAALHWLIETDEGELALRLASTGSEFSWMRGDFGERRRRLEEVLRRAPDASPSLGLKALIALGEMLSLQGEAEEARAVLSKALTGARALDDAGSVAECLIFLGRCAMYTGAFAAATEEMEAGLTAARTAGDRWLIAVAQMQLGRLECLQGRPGHALTWMEEAVRGFRACGDAVMAAITLAFLGAATGDIGDHARSVACFRESLAIGAELESPWLLHITGDQLAMVYSGFADDDEVLAELVGALEALRRTRGLGRPTDEPRRDRLTAKLRARLGDERVAAYVDLGDARSFDKTVSLIRQVLDGLLGAEAGAHQSMGGPSAVAGDPFSPREREVLVLLAAGQTNREIAARLHIAERTVKVHLTSLYNKLGVASRTQALAAATQRGLL